MSRPAAAGAARPPRRTDRADRPRVLVTQPRDHAAGLMAALAERDCDAVLLPSIRTLPPADPGALAEALTDEAGWDWLVVTSAAAVPHLVAALADRGRGWADLGRARVAAVGPTTAEALAAAGRPPDLVPAVPHSLGLAEAFGDLTGQRVLLPRSDIAWSLLPDALTAAGADVVRVEAYRTVPEDVDYLAAALMAAGAIDVVTFTSGSGIRAFLLWSGARPLLERAGVVCIGPTTADAARAAGLRVDAVAAEPTAEALARAAAAVARARRETA
jgi:uroporphyrinogen-III synthase